MFDESLIVQSAISAFNNAALAAPSFFWIGILTLPLMAMTYFCGGTFMERIGWHRTDINQNSATMALAVTLIWLIIFGGNYNVLRDASSVLNYLISGIIFICCLAIGAVSRGHQMPNWRTASWRKRIMMIAGAVICLALVALSGPRTILGAVIPAVAFAGGLILGRKTKRNIPMIPASLWVMFAVTVAILMQPEFFRFGQLGNLTIVHLMAIMLTGLAIVTAAALRRVHPRGKIHHSAYIKIKWMARFIVALAAVLFLLTESVPVFLGGMAAWWCMCALSIWHSNDIDQDMALRFWAVAMGLFGLITTLPVISALGVVVWTTLPQADFRAEIRRLL